MLQTPKFFADTINSSFVEKLIGHFESSSEQTKLCILSCLIAINKVCDLDNPVLEGMKSVRMLPLFGEMFISDLNKQCTSKTIFFHIFFLGNKLKLLKDISKSAKLFDDLFYTNDVVVLKHILARELINNEDEMVCCF